MTRMQAEVRAKQLNQNGRQGRTYVAELQHGRTWCVAEYIGRERGASTYYA